MGKAFQQKQETVIHIEATVRRKDRKSSGYYKPQCPSTPRIANHNAHTSAPVTHFLQQASTSKKYHDIAK